jgi:hypothetical protein
MTERQLQLLKEVGAGKWTHRCASQSPRELEAFQSVVDELLRLEAMGYVGRCEALTETFTGRGYVNRVYVRGGLSEEGRRVLQSLGAPTARGEKPV